MKKIKCCICRQSITESETRNANPMITDGRCCSECDNTIVVPLRLSHLSSSDIESITIPNIDKSIRLAKIQLKRIFPKNKQAYKDMCFLAEYTYNVMSRTYIFGQIQRLKGVQKLNEQEFINSFNIDIRNDLAELLYRPYSDGYDNTDFDDTLEFTQKDGTELSLGCVAESNQNRISRAMRRSKSGLKTITNGNNKMFDDFTGLASEILRDMNKLHNDGAAYKKQGKAKLSYLEFISRHDELSYTGGVNNLPYKQHMELCKMMYDAWCKGYDSIMA